MRHFLIAAAALAVGGFVVSTSALAQQGTPPYVAGGPAKIGGWCLVNTDVGGNDGYGYYAPCGQQAVAQAPAPRARAASSHGGYEAGGPAKIGNMCFVNTDVGGNDAYGYSAPCK